MCPEPVRSVCVLLIGNWDEESRGVILNPNLTSRSTSTSSYSSSVTTKQHSSISTRRINHNHHYSAKIRAALQNRQNVLESWPQEKNEKSSIFIVVDRIIPSLRQPSRLCARGSRIVLKQSLSSLCEKRHHADNKQQETLVVLHCFLCLLSTLLEGDTVSRLRDVTLLTLPSLSG